MVEIKAKKVTKKYGITSIVYKNGRKKEAKIEFKSDGTYMALCAFHSGSCVSFGYSNLEKAKQNTEIYLNNIHCFSDGANVTYI